MDPTTKTYDDAGYTVYSSAAHEEKSRAFLETITDLVFNGAPQAVVDMRRERRSETSVLTKAYLALTKIYRKKFAAFWTERRWPGWTAACLFLCAYYFGASSCAMPFIDIEAVQSPGGALLLIVEFVIWFFVIIAAIALVQAVRRVPVQYAKRVVGNRQYGGVRQYIPLKINAAGVMPIIFAQALMLFPLIFSRWDATRGLAATLGNYTGFWYNFIFFLLVVVFTYFYTAVTVNPQNMSEDMKRNGGFIPGVKPGKKTMEYLDSVMSRVTLPGSIFLGIISILPAIAIILGVNNSFGSFFGGTSLLILVGVILDTLQQVEDQLNVARRNQERVHILLTRFPLGGGNLHISVEGRRNFFLSLCGRNGHGIFHVHGQL